MKKELNRQESGFLLVVPERLRYDVMDALRARAVSARRAVHYIVTGQWNRKFWTRKRVRQFRKEARDLGVLAMQSHPRFCPVRGGLLCVRLP